MFEPSTLPSANDARPLNIATRLDANSGSDVPPATSVMAIVDLGTPQARAIAEALSTKRSPPQIRPPRPRIIHTGMRHAGMGFALSIDEVKPLVEQLINQGHVSRPYMGVTIDSQYQVNEETAKRYDIPVGIMIYEVAEGSPAERAGLKAGDIIYRVNNTLIQTFDDLSEIIDDSKVGDELQVVVNRDGQKVTANVVLGDGGGR